VRAASNRAISPNWRKELEQAARSKGVNNQGVAIGQSATIYWEGLRFRSQSEVRIAMELQKRNILFFPNCLGRLRKEDGFGNAEPDFLVCSEGKWGIIEVDGEPFHPPTRTAAEQIRDRWFKMYGVSTIEHFDAKHCFDAPGIVVEGFLRILMKA
jgi:hypothetical protein